MSKTSVNSRPAALSRLLGDSELDAVTGGRITNLRGAAIVRLLPSPPVVPVTGTVTVNSGPLAF